MKHHSHWLGWVVLAAVVVAADYYGDRTMSDAFRSGTRNRYARPVMVAGCLLLNGHLFGLIPERYDPIHRWLRVHPLKCSDQGKLCKNFSG
jgi:hypothetical protein